jgi:epoxyqueuosine reductase
VDTGPVVERSLATAAGLGWTGKNTCLIHPKLGSFGFLAVLLTSLEVQAGRAQLTVPDRCGSCTRCLEACPTGALIAPYQNGRDAVHLLSDDRASGAIAEDLMAGMGRQVFGCDICQDVCPWNRKAPVSGDAELEARPELVNPALEWLAELEVAEFERYSMDRRCDGQDSWGCGGTWRLRWETAGSRVPWHGSKSGRRRRMRDCARQHDGRLRKLKASSAS